MLCFIWILNRKEVLKMELREFIGKRIKEYRLSHGMSQEQLANKLNITKQSVSRYENGDRQANQDMLFLLSNIFNVSIDDFFPESNAKREENLTNEYTYYPTLISAGIPQDVEPITKKQKISISDHVMGKYAGRNDLFITKISGDSMDNIMKDKSLIVVEPTTLDRLKNGDIVVYSNDYEYSVKHYYKHNDTLVFKPNSTNPIHHDQTYNIDDNITIHGKVVLYIVNLD